MSENSEFSVNDLIDQIKLSTVETKKVVKENPEITKENLEEFVLNSTGRLVKQGLEIVEGVKEYVMNNPESREVMALSEALKAVASALSVVKDIQVTQMKKDSSLEIKKLEIESRKQLKNADVQAKFLMSRDEIFKKIMEEAKTIEAEAITINSNQAPSELSDRS